MLDTWFHCSMLDSFSRNSSPLLNDKVLFILIGSVAWCSRPLLHKSYLYKFLCLFLYAQVLCSMLESFAQETIHTFGIFFLFKNAFTLATQPLIQCYHNILIQFGSYEAYACFSMHGYVFLMVPWRIFGFACYYYLACAFVDFL